MTTRALIYCRQSNTEDEDDSLSLDFQVRECRALAVREGWTVLEPPIVDPDLKGWDAQRPGIQTLIERVGTERADVVIVYAMSRFARDYILQETVWRQILAAGASRLVSVHEPHAEDDLVRGILGVVAQADRKRMGAFLSSSFRERARRGLPHGKVPFGFVKGADGRLVVDDDAAAWVRQMVDHIEAGWSLWKVAAWLNQHGVDGRTWEPNVVRNTVRTPAIAGGVKTADVLTWDAHPAIIDRERYARLCRLLETRRPIRRGKLVSSWLEGLIVCGCGAPMYLITDRHNYDPPRGQFRCGSRSRAKRFGLPQPPYCDVPPRSIMQDAAERGAVAALRRDLARLLDPDAVYDALLAEDRAALAERARARQRLERQRQRADTERDRLLMLYQRGSLDADRWEAADADVTARIRAIDAELAGIPGEPDRAALRQTHAELLAIRDAVTQIAAVAPKLFRSVLLDNGLTVQRTPDGVRIRWPAAVAALLDRDTDNET